jgi:hypothetical protein
MARRHGTEKARSFDCDSFIAISFESQNSLIILWLGGCVNLGELSEAI